MVNMETIRKSQNSFAGGEISPRVLGRVDLAKFNTGVRYSQNCFIEIEGAISNRAGYEYGDACATDSGAIRFIPFEAPGDVNYVIEMTDQKFRFIFNNALVLDTGVPVEVTTPYLAADLYDLKFAQSNDIMTIVHPSYAPRELRRTAANAFSLVSISTNPTVTAPSPSIAVNTGGAAGQTEQSYVVSALSSTGNESLPSAKVSAENHLTDAGDKIEVQWNEVAGADAYIIYKRRAGQYGFMGFIRAEDQFSGSAPSRVYRAIDNNINPNTAQTPKRQVDPFPTSDDNPSVTFFFQQRRAFAGANNTPNTIINSSLGLFDTFKRSIPGLADDYFEFALGAARTQLIKHIVAVDDLIIFTSSNEWRLNISEGYSAVQPPDLRPQSSYGISEIPPILNGTDIFYLQASNRTVYRMNYSFDFNRFISDDISVLAKHLFRGRTVVGWCYAQQPSFLTFAYFDDGKAVLFAYNREQQVYAWTRVETDGFIDAAVSIRENGIDRIYVAVRRLVGSSFVRGFERMDDRQFDNVVDAFFVDAGVTNRDYISIIDISGGVIYADGPHGLSEDESIRLYDINGEFPDDDADINTRYKASVVNSTQITLKDYLTGDPVDIDDFIYINGGKVRPMQTVVTGLGHIEGRAVVALADGLVVSGLTVESGQVTLPFEAGVRTVGLPYMSEIHTLELEREDQPTRGRKKSVATFVGRVDGTRGIKVGLRSDKLYELKERDYEAYNDPVNPGSEIFRTPVGDGWEDELKLIIRQDYPLPVTLLSVIPEYTVGD